MACISHESTRAIGIQAGMATTEPPTINEFTVNDRIDRIPIIGFTSTRLQYKFRKSVQIHITQAKLAKTKINTVFIITIMVC